MNDFHKRLKYSVEEPVSENTSDEINLDLEELELLEDIVEEIEEFRKQEKGNSITEEQQEKNKMIQEKGFRSRAERILGKTVNCEVDTMIRLVKEAKLLKERYGYNRMSKKEKQIFEERMWDCLYGRNKEKEDICPEKAEIIDERII